MAKKTRRNVRTKTGSIIMTHERLSAREAGKILGVDEKTVRRWIRSGKLHATKVSQTRYEISPEDLPTARTPDMLDRLHFLEGALSDLSKRVELLEAENRTLKQAWRANIQLETRYKPVEAAPAPLPVSPISLPRLTSPGGLPGASDYTSAGYFPNRSEMHKFLERHGIKYYTAKGWRDCPLTPEGCLRYARDHIRAAGYRAASVQLHICSVPGCPCLGILGSAGAMSEAQQE